MLRRGCPRAVHPMRSSAIRHAARRASHTKSSPEVRVRYAPSPTGYMHLGGLRTSLYNYLFAKKHNGKFLLRIEDTDQSQRLAIYQQHADQLLEVLLYPAASAAASRRCSEERCDGHLIQTHAAGLGSQYDRKCFRLTPEEIKEKLAQGVSFTIRMKVPPGTTTLNDMVRGTMKFTNSFVDDQVLLKSDRFPTYHLANVVDDHLMEITHVIRGEEWINSTPKHLMLYNMFGWTTPQFAHLPLLLNEDKSKLSKRQNDVSVDYYMEEGYLPEAIINFVAFLGWAPSKSTKEFFTLDELIKDFELESVHKAGAVVDLSKLKWFNQHHLRQIIAKNPQRIVDVLLPLLRAKYPSAQMDEAYIAKALRTVSERLVLAKDFMDFAYVFNEPDLNSAEARKFQGECWHPKADEAVQRAVQVLAQLPNWAKADIQRVLNAQAKALGITGPQLFHPLRLLLTGTSIGVGVADTMELLGRESVLARLARRPLAQA